MYTVFFYLFAIDVLKKSKAAYRFTLFYC